MIDSCKNVPLPYVMSRDYQAILKLLDILINVEKSDIDNLISCINPDKCPNKYLPLLASYVGYNYDYNLSYNANRLVIRYYPDLIRNRGSSKGILLACAVVLNMSGILDASTGTTNYVNLVYGRTETDEPELNIYINKTSLTPTLFKLIEVVRPVGLGVIVHAALTIRSDDKVYITDQIKTLNGSITVYNRNKVMPNNPVVDDSTNTIGFGEIDERDGN